MILAAVSSGRSDLVTSRPTKRLLPLSATAATVSTAGCAAAGGRCGIEARGAHGDPWWRVEALHGGDGVARVDRALKGVGADDLGHVAQLRDVEQAPRAAPRFCPRPWPGRRCGCSCQPAPLAASGFGRPSAPGSASACSTWSRRQSASSSSAAAALWPATSRCTSPPQRGGGDGVERGALDGGVVVFGNDEAVMSCSPCEPALRSPWLRS